MINFLFLGPTELIVIVVLVLLLFGGRKIPELMKGIGKGIKGFKDEVKEGKKEDTSSKDSKLKQQLNEK
ncbi:MAG: twin-arginine translocase TatA/TatE family subunit [Prevotellaceae bacterium]|jgi:sec-independent protein translocase protein TatA|nr:twin-arginine translocase TatA/TatE family subunit [Prevotellaceae bacterium]